MKTLIESESQGNVMVVRICRPERRNALTQDMYRTITTVIQAAIADDDMRAIVLMGSGGSFCTGNDLSDFPSEPANSEPTPVWDFLETVVRCPLPIIAAVDGVAAGLGATILLHLDAVVSSAESRIHYSFINMALVPEAGSSLLLPQMMGYTRAAQLLLTGDPLSGEEAAAMGIVSKLAAAQEVDAVALELAGRIAAKPSQATRRTKKLLKGDIDMLMNAVRKEEVEVFAQLASVEFTQALAAFSNKGK